MTSSLSLPQLDNDQFRKSSSRASSLNEDTPYVSSDAPSDDASDEGKNVEIYEPPEFLTTPLPDRVNDKEHRPAGLLAALGATFSFYVAIWHFYFRGGRYADCPVFKDAPHAKAQIFSLCTTLAIWNRPHYRTGSYQDDMTTNLRNVALPGTGIPLSLLAASRWIATFFLVLGYPLVCVVAGVIKGGLFDVRAATQAYSEQLLVPQDWFSFWRLNCVVASYHAAVNAPVGFQMEDKWTFLTAAEDADVPVSPWLNAPALVIKDKNEEGGMGIHFYRNAVHGGDWIIQEKLSNAPCIAHLLPENAPLSTLRVITGSRGGLRQGTSSGPTAPLPGRPQRGDVSALSCVFRAGRAGGNTDHDSILFDVDLRSGRVLKGTTNMHWYQLGLHKVGGMAICRNHTITEHPDTGKLVTGHVIPSMDQIRALCEDAHHRLLPDVPFAGWDVALTAEAGMCLLEVNLSCNFFRGTFDQPAYFALVNDYFAFLDEADRKR